MEISKEGKNKNKVAWLSEEVISILIESYESAYRHMNTA